MRRETRRVGGLGGGGRGEGEVGKEREKFLCGGGFRDASDTMGVCFLCS